VALLRLAEDQHMLLLVLHHIVSDGWSNSILFREIGALYAAFSQGRPAQLPPLPLQYADFALWQRQGLAEAGERAGSPLQTQLAYWKQQLAGVSPLALPTDYPRPPVPTGQGATHTFQVPLPVSQALGALNQREGVTLFMTLLAAWQALLARYSGQEDIAVGTPIANRTRAEFEGLIGCFVNTLVLRSDLAGNPSLRVLLERVRAGAGRQLPDGLRAGGLLLLFFEQYIEQLAPFGAEIFKVFGWVAHQKYPQKGSSSCLRFSSSARTSWSESWLSRARTSCSAQSWWRAWRALAAWASPATVGASKKAWTEISSWSTWRRRETKRVACNESPARSKKLSWTPT
jgi:hypothetical protein